MSKEPYHHGDLKNALIQAGIEILSREGVAGLSLRKAARMTGVSHAAPYAHFADKQALVAAISTMGYYKVYESISAVIETHFGDPARQLVEAAWAYLRFAVEEPAHFKITFSGMVERETDYPALVEITRRSFDGIKRMIERCQAEGVLYPGPSDLLAVCIWSQVHGLASLMLEGQISHTVLEQTPMKTLLITCLQQVARVPLT